MLAGVQYLAHDAKRPGEGGEAEGQGLLRVFTTKTGKSWAMDHLSQITIAPQPDVLQQPLGAVRELIEKGPYLGPQRLPVIGPRCRCKTSCRSRRHSFSI